ncbi:MAG: hydroxymethylglutaryl-CoA lyase [Runella slithyformis]|nr:MAG: hydroxymethylglutaryl-CoA lyase [Runella sp.]TAG20162.1 MAG: hydroxymethylglutaryl-CoA lyase [Cytophagales bacterium]TAG39281.1 MAG: hydroxymethylglutaryl-CoA lyase [Cytophagia bacterium]TAG56775.1 MAG: hydroxymethylglutaryl-CoA lyase [Runella slithyformis]TAG68589.1 MAG: hydroxymethylglutaryl-CoA lyase [Runella slithyformis]
MKIIESSRQAMQGVSVFIPTDQKIKYLNKLLGVGFDTLDFGAFGGNIAQMHDTAEVLSGLDLSETRTKLMAAVQNAAAAKQAAAFEAIDSLAFTLSVSETFQLQTTNQTIAAGLTELAQVQEIAGQANKKWVVYLSMGFGNPHNDPYSSETMAAFAEKLAKMGVTAIVIADSTASSTTDHIKELFGILVPHLPQVEFGVQLYAKPSHVAKKVKAAYKVGVRRIDGTLRGFGNCSLSTDKLAKNLATELIVSELQQLRVATTINDLKLAEAMLQSQYVFE